MSLERQCSACGTPFAADQDDVSLCPSCTAASADFTRTAPSDINAPTPSVSRALPIPPPKNLQTIGDFEVLEKVGQGGMGAVYKARQISFDRYVALKILPAQFEEDEDYVARFQREAALAASLNHANLVRVYSSGYLDGCHYIAMELVEGENLRQTIKRGGMTMSDALRIVADVARGLECGWQKAQLIHRDIKPSNIYIAHNGDVKLGDLGLAKSLLGNTTGLTQTGAAMGTALYMSPEQARGEKNLDFRADIYSLGCTLFELLTGRPPYEGSDQITVIHKHLNAPLPAILKVLPNCPMPLVKLVGKMLKKHRHERHTSYEDLIAEIEWVKDQIDGATAAAPPPVLVARAQSSSRLAASGDRAPSHAYAQPPHKTSWAIYAGVATVAIAALVLVIATMGAGKKGRADVALNQRSTAAGMVVNEKEVTAPPVEVESSADEPDSDEPESTSDGADFAWRNALAEAPLRDVTDAQKESGQGTLLPAGNQWRFPLDRSTRTAALRVRALIASTPDVLEFRMFFDDGMAYRARFNPSERRWSLSYNREQGTATVIESSEGIPALTDGIPHHFMWARYAGRIMLSVDGTIIFQTPDRSSAPGKIGLECPSSVQARVQRMEYVDLENVPGSAAIKLLAPRAAKARARARSRFFKEGTSSE